MEANAIWRSDGRAGPESSRVSCAENMPTAKGREKGGEGGGRGMIGDGDARAAKTGAAAAAGKPSAWKEDHRQQLRLVPKQTSGVRTTRVRSR